MAPLRRYHLGVPLTYEWRQKDHIINDDKTHRTFVSRRCQIPHIRGVMELSKVPLLASKSLANANQFSVQTNSICSSGEPKVFGLRTIQPGELGLLTIQPWKSLYPTNILILFTSAAQPLATGRIDTSNAIAAHKLSAESTPQVEPAFHAVEGQKGPRTILTRCQCRRLTGQGASICQV